MQAAIGQNRSIFPKWTNQPVTIGTNGLTEPADSFAWFRRNASRGRAGRRLPLCADPSPNCFGSDHTLSAKSEVGLTLAGSPLRAVLPPYRHRLSGVVRFWPLLADKVSVSRRGSTAYPIVTFDKTDRTTLESFNSLAGRMDCGACARRNDRRARNAKSNGFPACSVARARPNKRAS